MDLRLKVACVSPMDMGVEQDGWRADIGALPAIGHQNNRHVCEENVKMGEEEKKVPALLQVVYGD